MMCPTCDGIGKEWFDGSDCIPCGGTGLVTPERTANDDRDEDAAEQEAAPAWTEEMARRQASSLLPWEHFERLDAAGAFRRAPERTTNDDLQEDAVERDRASDAASDALTEEQQRNREMHLTLALIHGFNEMAMKAITLGEKVYYRLSRDAAEKRFDELGGTIKRVDERPTVLVIPGHVPEIRFDERDIGLMRECVARYDREATAADQPAPASTGNVDADSPNAVDVLREALERACPVTGDRFFMTLKHPELGWLPTYGGPYDSFGPVMVDDVGALYRWRYCHDRGGWTEQEAVDRLLLKEEQLDDAVQDARREGYADAVARMREWAKEAWVTHGTSSTFARHAADWLEAQVKEGDR